MPLTIEFETSLRQIHAFSSLQNMRHKLSEHIRMFSGIEWQQKNLKSITNSPISVGNSAVSSATWKQICTSEFFKD